jgi:hypothetical protein
LLLLTYSAAVAAMVGFGRRRGARLPDRLPPADLGLLTLGIFRASRLITKDSITSVARSPFTEFEEPAGQDEVNERAVGHGLRHALGELVSCPFCISVWLATLGVFGLVVAPRTTRIVCSVLAAVTGSDYLQYVHEALQKAS